jgi:adenylylsulfate kinase
VSASAWAVWITGPPASGKTAVARAFLALAASRGEAAVHLESDALRRVLTPRPTYEPEERDRFYRQLADLAALLAGQGFPVVIDATGPRREHRARARRAIASFAEVLVDAPLEVRQARDPKGLYRRARAGEAPNLPGATSPYERPESPELSLSGTDSPEEGARAILAFVEAAGWARRRL